jgi:dTMP kinase
MSGGTREPGRGPFVTFEGVEGSGKSTQLARLAERLTARGLEVVRTKEPGGTAVGAELRALLLRESTELVPEAELLLYVADRAQHVRERIEPALAEGKLVLCDRYADATMAYQAFGRGLDRELVRALHARPPLSLRPDRTVLLDLDPEPALARARRRNRVDGTTSAEGRFERERLEFHRRVRDGYLTLAREEPERFRVVDAAGKVEAVAARVVDALADLLPVLSEVGS